MSEIWTPGGKKEDTIWTPEGEKDVRSEPVASEQTATDRNEKSYPLPPPTFEFLVTGLKVQAEMCLHLYGPAEPGDDKAPKADFAAAKHIIDTLGMLQEKTKNNLTLEEQRLIENSLTELRFRYVMQLEESQQKK